YSAMFPQAEKKSEEKAEKPAEDQTSTPAQPSNSDQSSATPPTQPPTSTGTTTSTDTNSQTTTAGASSAAATAPAAAATSAAAAAATPVQASAFQDSPQETPTKTQTPEKTEITDGLGIKLWSFLQKSNYPELENSDISYEVVKNSSSQIDVVMSFNQKTTGETTSNPAKLIFSIQNLEDNQSYDYLVKYNPLVLFDFRKNQKTESGAVSKISSLNRTDIEIELNSKTIEETEVTEEVSMLASEPVAETVPTSEATTTASTPAQNTANPQDGIILKKPVILGNGTQPALKNGVVMLAFSLKKIEKGKKTHLLSSKDGKGLFISKVEFNKRETLVIGLDQNGSDAASGEMAYPAVGLISGVQGNALGFFEIKQSKLERNATAPLDFEMFSQKNINLTNQSANFDLLKEDDLLFLTISKKDTNYTFTLSSSRNPLSQKIVSNLNLEDSFPKLFNGHLDWSYLGPNPANESGSTVTVRGLAIYDSVDLADQESISQVLTNAFIKELTS
ncbi:hypothetical protein R7X07_02300, partial [Mesomycoplasma ovipneumoniae]